jgi:hypothetical protein
MESDYYLSQSAGTQITEAEAMAIVAGVFMFILVISLISYIVTAWLLGRIFKKAGVKQWIAWVPVYNGWKTLELGNQQGFWAVLALVPPVGIISAIFTYISMYHIGKKLGKEDWFVLLAIFLPIVWLVWLAFDDSKWPKNESSQKTAPIAS